MTDPRDSRALRLEPVTDEEPAMLMTSMIDVIFIVLAFFVCVSEVKKGRLGVDVPQVPNAEASAAQGDKEPIVVEVTGDDRVFVCGEAARSEEELTRLIAQAVERLGTDAAVHLSGDRQAKNGTMMRVVSHLSKAGLKRIEFAVQAGG
ncbi:MAG: biopolymer transporter ExbD [Planctomycetes bacterium]|nr:biopolymer transporter ExbD [Planctomycetota bacterium]MCW8142179.1 biopolymer transporter ExbD [Planctomycetota bacterium]